MISHLSRLVKWFLDLFKKKGEWVAVSSCVSTCDMGIFGLKVWVDNEPVEVLKVDYKRGRIKVRLL